MTPNELRIGNWIKDGNDFEQVTIDHLNCLNSGRCEFEPIQLTEEWLLKFGFEYYNLENLKCSTLPKLEAYKHVMIDGFGIVLKGWHSIPECKYVHQLQNLFFSLTNQELTFKP